MNKDQVNEKFPLDDAEIQKRYQLYMDAIELPEGALDRVKLVLAAARSERKTETETAEAKVIQIESKAKQSRFGAQFRRNLTTVAAVFAAGVFIYVGYSMMSSKTPTMAPMQEKSRMKQDAAGKVDMADQQDVKVADVQQPAAAAAKVQTPAGPETERADAATAKAAIAPAKLEGGAQEDKEKRNAGPARAMMAANSPTAEITGTVLNFVINAEGERFKVVSKIALDYSASSPLNEAEKAEIESNIGQHYPLSVQSLAGLKENKALNSKGALDETLVLSFQNSKNKDQIESDLSLLFPDGTLKRLKVQMRNTDQPTIETMKWVD